MMKYSRAELLRFYLAEQGVGVIPSSGQKGYPLFVNDMPIDSDNVIAIYDVRGMMDGKTMRGVVFTHPGVHIEVRGTDHPTAQALVSTTIDALDSLKQKHEITVDGFSYIVDCVYRLTDAVYMGEEPERRRVLFSVNARMSFSPPTMIMQLKRAANSGLLALFPLR